MDTLRKALFYLLAIFVLATNARKKEDRIYKGRPADIEEFAHQVSIQVAGNHLCGGSIISKLLILTAAHCTEIFDKIPQSMVTVKTGVSDAAANGDVHSLRAWTRHDGYVDNATFDEHDIALLLLKTPIRFNDKQKPISLAKETPLPRTVAMVSGFGRTEYGDKETKLMVVEIPIMPLSKCKKTLDKVGGVVTDDMICAGGYTNQKVNKDACTGDSGGPLVVNNVQVGVVAWGIGCGSPGLPGVYSNVAYYSRWIAEHSKRLLLKAM